VLSKTAGAAALLALCVASPHVAAGSLPPWAHEEKVASTNVPWLVPVVVLTPPSYESSDRSYPTLYFLHDSQENERALLSEGIAEGLRDAMREGSLAEAVVVAPRGTGTWFVDSFDGRVKYDSFLTSELVPWVEKTYRVRKARSARAALGISMGGYGALHWGFRHPELFCVVGGLSPAVETLNWKTMTGMPFFLRPWMRRVFGNSETSNTFVANDLYDGFLSDPALASRVPEVVLRCGREDRYRLGELSAFFRDYLEVMGVKVELTLEPGVHEWTYWRTALPKLFRSVAEKMRLAA